MPQSIAMTFFLLLLYRRFVGGSTSQSVDIGTSISNPSCDLMQCTPERCSDAKNFSTATNLKDLRACDCHPDCRLFGTCCSNYEKVCSPNEVSKPTLVEEQISEGILTCEPILARSNQFTFRYKVLLVTRCRRPLLPSVRQEDVKLCEVLGNALDQYVLIYHGSVLYRNVHCLRCNGHEVNASDQIIRADFRCTDALLGRLINTPKLEETLLQDVVGKLNSKVCSFTYDFEVQNFASICYRRYFDSCNALLENSVQYYAQIEQKCKSYSDYVQGFDPSENISYFYKNIHCALCNDLKAGNYSYSCIKPSELRNDTRLLRFNYVQTFSILLDLSGRISVNFEFVKQCSYADDMLHSEFVNLSSNECFEKRCPEGYRLFDSSTCIVEQGYSFKQIGNQIKDQDSEYGIHIYIYHRNQDSKNQFGNEFTDTLVRIGDFKIRHMFQKSCTSGEIICLALYMKAYGFNSNLAFLSSKKLYDVIDIFGMELEIVKVRVVIPGLDNIDRLNSVVDHTLTVHSSTVSGLVSRFEAEQGKVYPLLVYLPEFDSILSLDQLSFDIDVTKDEAGNWVTVRSVAVAIDNHFNCSVGGSCVSVKTSPEAATNSDNIEVRLTESCNILSVAALGLSLLFRCTLPRTSITFPVIIQISIQVSLLCAHLLFLFGNLLATHDLTCALSSSLQHFSWISSFAFMNILSRILYQTFKDLTVMKGMGCTLKTAYMLYGLGLPFVICSICFLLHYLGYFSYAADGVCWIRGPVSLALAFGLPVGLLIAINAVFFTLTALKLRQTTNDTSNSSQVKSFKFRFLLHIRLISIMGIAWIFGFLSNIPYLESMSYLFVSLASLNGFFVSISFMVNKTNMQHFKQRLGTLWTAA